MYIETATQCQRVSETKEFQRTDLALAVCAERHLSCCGIAGSAVFNLLHHWATRILSKSLTSF